MRQCTKLHLVLIAGVAAILPSAAAAQSCTDQTLKGTYGYTVTGTITQNVGPLLAGPFVAVGKISFDGRGGVTTVRSFNDNGFGVQHDPGSGTYTLSSDCTGSFTVTVGPLGNQKTLSLDIVLDDDYELRGVVTTQDVVLAFEGKRQLHVRHQE